MRKTIKKITQIHEDIKPIVEEKMSKLQVVREWFLNHFFVTFMVLVVINIFFLTNRNVPLILDLTALFLLILYIIIFIVTRIQKNINKLLHHELTFKDILKIYISSAIFIVLLFSLAYWSMTAVGTGYLKYGSCTDNVEVTHDVITQDSMTVRNPLHYPYFSAITFFTVGFGDICPMGMSKIVAILNALIGHAFTVIILSIAITNYAANKDNDKKEKKIKDIKKENE